MCTVDVEMDAETILRPGLYIARRFGSITEVQTYVVSWPEDTTWNDNADSTVRSNRVTFMRYLTKLCDQLVCLLSTRHSQAFVWRDGFDYAEHDSENDESDGFFDFRLAKTSKQEENVVARQGFTMTSSRLVTPSQQASIQSAVKIRRWRCSFIVSILPVPGQSACSLPYELSVV